MDLVEKDAASPDKRQGALKWELYGFLLFGTVIGCLAVRMMLLIDPRFILAVAAGLVGLLVAFFGGTRVCLPLYLATAYGDAFNVPGAPISVNQVLALLVTVAFVSDWWFRRALVFEPQAARKLFVVFVIYLLSVAIIKKPPETEYPVQAAFYSMLTLSITMHYWDRKWIRFLVGAVVVLGLLTLVIPGYVEAITGVDYRLDGTVRVARRINGLAKDSVVFASTCVWILLFCVYLAADSRSPLPAIFWGGCVPFIVAVSLLTFNRQTPIVILACLIVSLFFLRSRMKYLIGGGILMAALVASPFFLAKVSKRFAGAHSVLADASLVERHDKIEIAWNMFQHNPIFGVGHSAFKNLWSEYKPTGEMLFLVEYPRNKPLNVDMGYMQILTEYGIVGSTLVGLFFISCGVAFRKYYRMSMKLADPGLTNLLAMEASLFALLLISLLIRDAFFSPQSCVTFGIFFATCTAIRREADSVAGAQASATVAEAGAT